MEWVDKEVWRVEMDPNIDRDHALCLYRYVSIE